MSFKTKVDSNGHIKWGANVPLFFVSIVIFAFIGQYAIMGKEVKDTTNEVQDLNGRMYATEKALALNNQNLQYIRETVDSIERKFDRLIK